jgi:uncharacterized protein (DUF2147 family)
VTNASFSRSAAALVFAAAVQLAGAAPVAAAQTPTIEGVWLTAAKSEMTVVPCPEGYCGSITKIVVPPDLYKQNKAAIDAMGATSFNDEMNKDPNLRSRPILGLQILTLHAGDKPKIYDGQIYNPQDGNTYSGYVEVLGPNKIRLNGCILYNIICKVEDWTRVPQPVPDEAGTIAPGSRAAAAPAAESSAPADSFQ